jgi:hypothetical protein
VSQVHGDHSMAKFVDDAAIESDQVLEPVA